MSPQRRNEFHSSDSGSMFSITNGPRTAPLDELARWQRSSVRQRQQTFPLPGCGGGVGNRPVDVPLSDTITSRDANFAQAMARSTLMGNRHTISRVLPRCDDSFSVFFPLEFSNSPAGARQVRRSPTGSMSSMSAAVQRALVASE